MDAHERFLVIWTGQMDDCYFYYIPLRSMMDFKALVMLTDWSRAGTHSFVFKEDFLSSVRFSLLFSLVFPRSRTETATNILS